MTKTELAEIRAMLRARSEQERRREPARFGGLFARKPPPAKAPEPPALDPPPRRIGPAAQAEAQDRRLFGQRRAPLAEPPLVLDAPLALDGHAAVGIQAPSPSVAAVSAGPEFDPKMAAALHLEGEEILARLERLLAVEQAGLELRLGA